LDFLQEDCCKLPNGEAKRIFQAWINSIQDLWQGNKISVGEESFIQNKGLVQGSKLSPLLFAYYLDRCLSKSPLLSAMMRKETLKGFADDIAVVCRSWGDAS
jgi:hypothetical protein